MCAVEIRILSFIYQNFRRHVNLVKITLSGKYQYFCTGAKPFFNRPIDQNIIVFRIEFILNNNNHCKVLIDVHRKNNDALLALTFEVRFFARVDIFSLNNNVLRRRARTVLSVLCHLPGTTRSNSLERLTGR